MGAEKVSADRRTATKRGIPGLAAVRGPAYTGGVRGDRRFARRPTFPEPVPAVLTFRPTRIRKTRPRKWALAAPTAAALAGGVCVFSGCDVVPRAALVDSQTNAAALEQELATAAAERDQLAVEYQTALADRQHLTAQQRAIAADRDAALAQIAQNEHLSAKLQAGLDIANRRLENLSGERGELQTRYISLLRDVGGEGSPLGAGATRRFEELAAKYPDFDFDPVTGVSKFGPNVTFESGRAELNPNAVPLLREFAEIMASPEASGLNVLIVGHTDDERIAGAGTRAKHPTNWHLSTDRANEVAVTLAAAGLPESRMGVAGYSKYQPQTANRDELAKAKNRRVEIYVLAPEAKVAGANFPTRL